MTAEWLDTFLVCPSCKGDLESHHYGYRCDQCRHDYPTRYGIPDFRLQPDPFISIEDEVAKINRMLAAGSSSFSELLLEYYRVSPENPPQLHRHYIASMEVAVNRGRALLRKLESSFPDAHLRSLLDLGCGTAGMTVAGARRYPRVIATDVALRWLVIGQQRLLEEEVEAPLICANAEYLPFKPGCFDAVVADAVLEHVSNCERMRDEMLRVLRSQGVFFLTSNNRYSILPEPHVKIWGFGFLPRKWMEPLAARVWKTPYKARLHSRRELKKLFEHCGEVKLPFFEQNELGHHAERLRRYWEKMRRIPLLSSCLGGIIPLYFIMGRKRF